MLLGDIVNTSSPVQIRRVLLRTVFLCALTVGFLGLLVSKELWLLVFFILGLIDLSFGLVRIDRRQLHDVLAGTAVVYSWDARLAQYRNELEKEENQRRASRWQNDASETNTASGSFNRRSQLRRHKSTYWQFED